jgi:hypothetical protein
MNANMGPNRFQAQKACRRANAVTAFKSLFLAEETLKT